MLIPRANDVVSMEFVEARSHRNVADDTTLPSWETYFSTTTKGLEIRPVHVMTMNRHALLWGNLMEDCNGIKCSVIESSGTIISYITTSFGLTSC